MNKIFVLFFLFVGFSYGAVLDFKISNNNTFITGKIDIIQRQTKLNISNHQINKGFHFQILHFIPLVPDFRFDYFSYSYLASGKVEINMIDVLQEANFPIFFGTSGIVSDDFKFGDFYIFDFFDDKDTVDMDINVNIKEYNFTFFYQLFKDAKISPKYGIYLKYIKSDIKRKIKTDIKDIKDSSQGSRIVPFLFLGFDINIPFSGLNLLFKTTTEAKILKYKETLYYNLEILETLYFTDIKYLSNLFFSIGYRHWRLKTDYEKDSYKIQQRLRWNMPFAQIGVRF